MTATPEWLGRYARNYHHWRTVTHHGKTLFVRPLGLVESSFDIDGTDFEGRADVNAMLTLEISPSLSEDALRQRVTLAWAALRSSQSLLRATIVDAEHDAILKLAGLSGRCFAVECLHRADFFMVEASSSIVFVADHYANVNTDEFYRHSQNTGRVFIPSEHLAKLFVLPLEALPNGNYLIRFLLVAAHQVTDGLTLYAWSSLFTDLLNEAPFKLETILSNALSASTILESLPPAQEDLYPTISGNLARQRWFWAIGRVLRHTRTPPPAAFQNPIRRDEPLRQSVTMPPTFERVLDYTKTPPLNSYATSVTLSIASSRQLHRLCREANVSIGAGCFTLVGMSLMSLLEDLSPSTNGTTPDLPFVGHFPLNPRPFFHYTRANSLMLAFSDGLALPFLPSILPFAPRFRLLARQAHRQLSTYQKRPRDAHALARFGFHAPNLLIPGMYIAAVERLESKLPLDLRTGANPQGAYPAKLPVTPGTCGVSSVGSVKAIIRRGKYALDGIEPGAFAADFRALKMSVRVRDGEFLVGSVGGEDGLTFTVSYDGNAMDEERVERWRKKMLTLIEGESEMSAKL